MTRLHKEKNETAKLFLNMPKDNIVMFTLSLFLFVVSIKNRIVLPNNSCNLKKSIS